MLNDPISEFNYTFFFITKLKKEKDHLENLPCKKIIIIHALRAPPIFTNKVFPLLFFFFKNDGNDQSVRNYWIIPRFYHTPSKYNAGTPSALNFFHFHIAPINISFFYKYRILPFNAK